MGFVRWILAPTPQYNNIQVVKRRPVLSVKGTIYGQDVFWRASYIGELIRHKSVKSSNKFCSQRHQNIGGEAKDYMVSFTVRLDLTPVRLEQM